MHHPTDDDLILHVYGEQTPDERTRIDAHLATCDACQDVWDEISRTLTLADGASVPEPPADFERVMWARVQAALPARPRSIWTWRALVPLTSLAALIVAAVVVGRFWVTPEAGDAAAPVDQAADAADARERALFTALDGHFSQTEMLLVELMNGQARTTEDRDFARTTAEDLVSSGRLYRATAEQTGHRALAAVLEDLEPVLVEVARGPEAVDAATVRTLRERIDDEGLLFKVRAVATERDR